MFNSEVAGPAIRVLPEVTPMSKVLFLSTATTEFGPLRKQLADLLQRTKRIHVRHQDDFVHRGVRTLQSLQEEIKASDIVLHWIGRETGGMPPVEQVKELRQSLPDLKSRFSDIVQLALEGKISYTQWEAWLAIYYGKRLCSFEMLTASTSTEAKERAAATADESAQWQHLNRLRAEKHYPKSVADPKELYDEVLLSLIELNLLTPAEAHRPIRLPFASIGALFKGREAFLDELRNSLNHSHGGHATAIVGKAIHGLGGIGKTRLAVEYAWQHLDQFSAVLFVTADSPESLRRELAELTGPLVLNLPEHAQAEEEVRIAAAVRWLQDHSGWFLILDNVDNEQAAMHVEELLTRLAGGKVVITSRLANWSDFVVPLELDVLPTAAAIEFLLERTAPKSGGRGRKVTATDREDAASLAKELDGLALALEQAGAYVCVNRISLAEYVKRWRVHDVTVQEWHRQREMQYPRSLATTWQTSIDQLDPQAAVLLNLLAWFAPEPIPESILRSLTLGEFESAGRTESDTISGSPDAIETLFQEPALRESLISLADLSLIRWETAGETVTVHRVVQEIVRCRQQDPRGYLERSLQLLDQSVPPGSPDDVRTWDAWEPLRPHMTSATQEAFQRGIIASTTRLMGALATFLGAKALHREAEGFERQALQLDEDAYGSSSPQVATRLNNLALTLMATNRLSEAEPLMRRALDIHEASFGGQHPYVAKNLNNLALLLKATNRLSEAEPLMRRALDIDEASFGDHHPEVAIDLHNLAQLLQATNRLSEAEPLMRRALQIFQHSLSESHPHTLIVAENYRQLLEESGLSPQDATQRIRAILD